LACPLEELLTALRGGQVIDLVSIEFTPGYDARLWLEKDVIDLPEEEVFSLLMSDQPEPTIQEEE
jgi:hypothetical protein